MEIAQFDKIHSTPVRDRRQHNWSSNLHYNTKPNDRKKVNNCRIDNYLDFRGQLLIL